MCDVILRNLPDGGSRDALLMKLKLQQSCRQTALPKSRTKVLAHQVLALRELDQLLQIRFRKSWQLSNSPQQLRQPNFYLRILSSHAPSHRRQMVSVRFELESFHIYAAWKPTRQQSRSWFHQQPLPSQHQFQPQWFRLPRFPLCLHHWHLRQQRSLQTANRLRQQSLESNQQKLATITHLANR